MPGPNGHPTPCEAGYIIKQQQQWQRQQEEKPREKPPPTDPRFFMFLALVGAGTGGLAFAFDRLLS